jgi:hypothetical protein
MDRSFPERSALQVSDKMELLDICFTATYFQFEDKFYQQKEGTAMGSSLSPMVSNIFMKKIEEISLDAADHKPAKCLRYVDDTFVVWPHGPARLQQFHHHLSSLTPTIEFIIEVETNDTFPFLDVSVLKKVLNWP